MPRPLFTPGKDPVPIVQEAGWTPGPVGIPHSGMWRRADWSGADNLRLAVHVRDASTVQLLHLPLPFTLYTLRQSLVIRPLQ